MSQSWPAMRICFFSCVFFLTAILLALLPASLLAAGPRQELPANEIPPKRDGIVRKYAGASPKEWGEALPGIVQTLGTQDDVVALTLDLCGSKSDSFDHELAEFLVRHGIPATFFVNSRWIRKNPDIMAWLASVPIFELEGHGLLHLPASLNGRQVYGIRGTRDAGELYDEVVRNADDIEKATGVRPRFFRSGTAYYDEQAVALIHDLGVHPIGFSILGDAGATYSEQQVFAAVSRARGGDVIIAHANHPEKATGRGLMRVLPELRARGLRFVKLYEYLANAKNRSQSCSQDPGQNGPNPPKRGEAP